MDDYIQMSPELVNAMKQGDVERVMQLVEAGEDLRAIDYQEGWTLLHWAAHYGHTELVRALLDRGADIECKDEESQTPLMLAAFSGHLDTVRLLLGRGASPAAGTRGWDAASFANLKDHKAISNMLLAISKKSEPAGAAEKRERAKFEEEQAKDAAAAVELFLARPENRESNDPLVGVWQTLAGVWILHADGTTTSVRKGGRVSTGPLWRATPDGELIQDPTNVNAASKLVVTRWRLSPDENTLYQTTVFGTQIAFERKEPRARP